MFHRVQSFSLPVFNHRARWILAFGALTACTALLTWTASGFQGFQGWGPFAIIILIAAMLMWGSWKAVDADQGLILPAWLGWAVIAAGLLRLAAGVLWFITLPTLGYGNPAESLGYVMADAHQRDLAAWELAQSDDPLIRSFTGYRKADQYGGLLFLSGFVYRYFGGEYHQPLQLIVLSAAVSALTVLFTWAFARRAWGEDAAALSAWVVAAYPEAVLLGSTQMREAFTVTLTVAGFYGLVGYLKERTWGSLGWVLGALALSLPFSPPFTVLLLGLLALQVLFIDGWQVLRNQRIWLVFTLLALLAGVGVWLAWDNFAPQGISNPIALIGWWLKKSAEWQAHLSERASGWIQRTFDRYLPVWAHVPFLVLYGAVRPFLPAALIDTGVPIWRAIAIWRSLGWALLLSFLIYGTWLAWSRKGELNMSRGLSLVIWIVVLLASFRGGGDVWDNPRYRAAFAGLQAALASWSWVVYRRSRDPWLRRILVAVGVMLVWFIPWYLRRYAAFEWPVVDLFKTIGLGAASAALLLFWDWVRANSP